ncbi:metallophosphoesterase [Phenylobacterium deserti]|uniref:Metallophosphoesterase n=2 Tax=Phenylobacterium deserti TaxID=1914756 RepID=A0A328ASY1_9CAUL|nr:metallophosphoesterase [Phenylobacterium deserti]
MRIAAISDIHGNLAALEAVLADIAARNVDVTVNLGDILSGPLQPVHTAERLMALGLPTIRGNHERQLLTQTRAQMGPSDAFTWPQLQSKHREWLASLPTALELTPDVLLCHGTPASDLEYFLETVEPTGAREATEAEVATRAAGAPHALILCGHTHVPRVPRVRRLTDGRLVVNPGSAGLPAYKDDRPWPHVSEAGSPHARYALCERGSDGAWNAEIVEVAYDWESAARTAEAHGRPDWAIALRTGRMTPAA